MAHKFSAIDLTSYTADPNSLLRRALAERNIQDFRHALVGKADPLAYDDNNKCVFEEALSTPGCVEFVKECLKAGCNSHHINTHFNKSAINFAADSHDPQILNAILSYRGANVNFKYSELTPINSLAKALNPENVDDVFKCIQILLQYGASPNTADQREMTPLHYIAMNTKIDDSKKLEMVLHFLAQPDLDIDTYRSGELRRKLIEKYPDLKLPVHQKTNRITFHMLLTYIRIGDMEKFHQQFLDIHRFTTEDENLLLLQESIVRGAHLACDLLMDSGVNYNKLLPDNNTVLEIAYVYGNWHALKKLLLQPDIKIEPYPLNTIVRKLNESSSQAFCDYWKCFDVLLNCDKIDINRMDRSRSTPLHYAVKYRNNEAIKKLLNKGADISIKNVFNELPIDGIHPEVLEEHFNSCITTNGLKPGEEKYEIRMNFRNLTSAKKLNQHFNETMTPMAFMAKTKDFHNLLQHPVITSYLYLKWHKLSLVFYVNFFLYLFYAISGIIHVVFKFRGTDYPSALAISGIMTWMGICYLIIRETIQFIMSPQRYVSSFTNYLEVLLIVLSVLTCTELHCVRDIQCEIAVLTILIAAVELCLLVGSLPVTSISTHMLMLEAVCKSFLKSFFFYSIFVITFTLCFYIMNDKVSVTDDKAFNKFATPMVAFSKTIVMLTGEFDASDFKLESFHLFILLIFVFFMTIIMLNLLNGLAVSDTQVIKAQAELNFIICRIHLLTRYEQLFIERSKQTKSLMNCSSFCAFSKCWLNLFPDYSTELEIAILPNDKNKIWLTEKKTEQNDGSLQATDPTRNITVPLTAEDEKIKHQSLLPRCVSSIAKKCSKMDSRTVQFAMAVLERKSETNIENRLKTMEQKLEEILKRLVDQGNKN